MVKCNDRRVSAPGFFGRGKIAPPRRGRAEVCFGGNDVKGKKGICLILCLLLILALVPCAAAVTGECVDGVWASIALTGGANKLIFTADSETEQKILCPDEQTDAQYILPEGVSYDAASNTLSLTDFNAPTANLVLTMMGGDFKIRLSGSSSLASVRSESMGRGGSITFCGDGALEINSAETAVLVRAGGAADFVRIEPQARLTASSAQGSAIRVENTALASGAISFDTTEPELVARDSSVKIASVLSDAGIELEPRTLAGEAGLFGLEAVIDTQTESIVYNVYSLGEQNGEGRYPAALLQEGVADVGAYQDVYTPHDWTVVGLNSGAEASQARFARFTVSASATDENGSVSLSQTQVGRGGSVTVSVSPREGCKLVSLTVNGEEVSVANGSYTIGGITGDVVVRASFVESAAVGIALTAPADTDFKVPGDGEADFVSEPFTARVTDGAGDEVGATVLWSIDPQTEGVSIGADGRVTVRSAAKEAAAEGPLNFTVKAIVEWKELFDESQSFTVSLAERKAARVQLTLDGEPLGESDTIPIPAAGESTHRQYGARVYDQYGALREETLTWSAGDWPPGVRRDGDTLSVTGECRDGSMLIVTATASSDSTVSGSVTVGFSRQADGAKGGASRAMPDVSWPSFTLAEGTDGGAPEYGLTWAQMVTLGEDGTATLGGETLPGSFSIDKADTARPNISDSFRIVFHYSEDGEDKTVSSEEHSVTLTRKPLSAAMITLTPDTMLYAFGEALTPAVSAADGSYPLVSGTDFQVQGYAGNTAIGSGSVTVEGIGNYKDTVTKNFSITPIPGSSVSCALSSRKPEDADTKPTIVLRYGERTLVEGTDYDLSLLFDIPSKTGTATIAFKGCYSGTRALSFDLPNYLITAGAGSSWSKSTSTALSFTANGALGKFTELTVDGKTVPASYYTTESGSTIVRIKADFLKSLTAGKHIVGIAYKDGKALAIFSVIEVDRRGVPTGDSSNLLLWVIVLTVSVAGVAAFARAFAGSGKKKKRKKMSK